MNREKTYISIRYDYHIIENHNSDGSFSWSVIVSYQKLYVCEEGWELRHGVEKNQYLLVPVSTKLNCLEEVIKDIKELGLNDFQYKILFENKEQKK